MLPVTKFGSLLLSPLTLAILLLATAALLSWYQRQRWLALLCSTGFVLLYLPATAWLSDALLSPLEARYAPVALEELPSADVIVVLGGATEGASRFDSRGNLNQASERLLRGLELYRAGKAPIVLLSGGASPPKRPEAFYMAQWLQDLGMPPSALLVETDSLTTYDNALYTAGILQSKGLKSVLLVTSAAHMRRALATFRKQGIDPIPVATDYEVPEHVGPLPAWVPTWQRLGRANRAIHEWFGYWQYALRDKL